MSRRRELERHRHSLGEIREIMNSMKTLAYLETHKLSRFLPTQQAVVASTEAIAADFLSFHPDILHAAAATTQVYLLIGTERGFCGDFNRQLLTQLEAAAAPATARILGVGRKLQPLLEQDARLVTVIDGASVVEEVPTVLQRLVNELTTLQAQLGNLSLSGIHHDDEDVRQTGLLPPFLDLAPPTLPQRLPPLLNVPAETFLLDLTDHYLFAALHQILYASLMAENHRRVAHLEMAVKHLDENAAELTRRCNALRQEEIIEEIEVILLSSAGPEHSPASR